MYFIPLIAVVLAISGFPEKVKDYRVERRYSLVRETPLEVTPHPSFSIPKGERYMPNQALLVFRKDISETSREDLIRTMGLSVVLKGKYADITVVEGAKDATDIVSMLKGRPEILIAEPNYIVNLLWTPNDDFFPLQWHFDSDHIRMPEAWDIEQGGSETVKVGVLDTGVAFENRAIPNYELGEVTSFDGFYHVAPDLTGTHFSGGYDAIHQDNYPNDQHGHGTHVTGTIAETTNNSYGIAGVAFNVTIVPIQVLNYYGSGTVAQVVDGIAYAITYGVDVINMSFGSSDSSASEHQVIQDAYNNGITLIGASGNDGTGSISYPALFPEVISVGATDYDDERAPYSNFGNGLDLVAPGGNTSEDSNGDSYADGVLQETYAHSSEGPGDPTIVDSFLFWFWQGTSMATPHVTGVAALLLSQGITGPQNIKNILIQSAVDLGDPGYDIHFGNGRLDAYAALSQAPSSYWDTLGAPFQEPYYAFQEQYQVEYEATRLVPSALCTLKTIEIAFYNYGGDNNASKACSLFVWANGNDRPGSTILKRAYTVTGIPAGYWSWVAFDVSDQNIVVSDTFWIGHYENASGPPSSLADTIPEYLNMWSTDGTSWGEDPFDYLQRAIVVCQGYGVRELAGENRSSRLKVLRNPSRGEAEILFSLKKGGDVTITLYDVQGRMVKKVLQRGLSSGSHRWSTGRLRPGVYFIELRDLEGSSIRKLVVL